MTSVSTLTSSLGSLSLYTGTTDTDTTTTDDTVDFLQLLLAQLKAQDPTSAMNSTEMMSQFAQLTTVQELQTLSDQMEALASANSMGYAANLIGKQVTATYGSGTVEGVVESVDIEDGAYMLTVGDYQVSISDLVKISAYEEEE